MSLMFSFRFLVVDLYVKWGECGWCIANVDVFLVYFLFMLYIDG